MPVSLTSDDKAALDEAAAAEAAKAEEDAAAAKADEDGEKKDDEDGESKPKGRKTANERIQELILQGRKLSTVLRTVVREHYGNRSEKLAEFNDRALKQDNSLANQTIKANLDFTVSPTGIAAQGGLGLTAQWDDDIHHAIHTAVSGERQGYYGDRFLPALVPAAHAADEGQPLDEVAEAAIIRAAASRAFFTVSTLEYLRRSGRIGRAQALLGTALAVKPILTLGEGEVVALEKVRTTERAYARIEQLAIETAGARAVDIAVHHLGLPEKAAQVAARIAATLGPISDVVVTEVGAVVGAHGAALAAVLNY